MTALEEIILKYEEDKAQLLYAYIKKLMELTSDEEFETIVTQNSQVFKQCQQINPAILAPHMSILEKAFDIFVRYLSDRGLTKDEFTEMTMDDVKDYISSLIWCKDEDLFNVIKMLEK